MLCNIPHRKYICICAPGIKVEYTAQHRGWNCNDPEHRKARARQELRRFDANPKVDWLALLTNVPFNDRENWQHLVRSHRGRWDITPGGIVIPGGVEPATFEYCRVEELGLKTGMRHYHIAIRGAEILEPRWKAHAKHFGYGWFAKIKPAYDIHGIKRYLFNYLVKAKGEPGRRKITYSRGFWEKPYHPYVDYIPESKGGKHVHRWHPEY
jgi:hypothetical protein